MLLPLNTPPAYELGLRPGESLALAVEYLSLLKMPMYWSMSEYLLVHGGVRPDSAARCLSTVSHRVPGGVLIALYRLGGKFRAVTGVYQPPKVVQVDKRIESHSHRALPVLRQRRMPLAIRHFVSASESFLEFEDQDRLRRSSSDRAQGVTLWAARIN